MWAIKSLPDSAQTNCPSNGRVLPFRAPRRIFILYIGAIEQKLKYKNSKNVNTNSPFERQF